MKHHTQILNHYIRKIHAKVYVEIGVFATEANFDKIICAAKIGVDPAEDAGATHCMTSDEYFNLGSGPPPADIYFLDGLHHADQLERDICNASKHLSRHGIIICHDTNPKEEGHTHTPRDSKIWNGNVYKTIVGFRQKYPLVKSYTYKEDHGITVIWPRGTVFEPGFVSDITWDEFIKNKKRLLNLI